LPSNECVVQVSACVLEGGQHGRVRQHAIEARTGGHRPLHPRVEGDQAGGFASPVHNPCLLDKGINLAWGGLVLDDRNNRLYLVSEEGKVYVIANPKTLNGSISGKSRITSFSLGSSSDRYNGGSVFGQASVDPNGDCLYVMENARTGEAARVWMVRNASKVSADTVAKDRHTFLVEGDHDGAGVAAGTGNQVYALFGGGKNFEDIHGEYIIGARLRLGADGVFPTSPLHKNPINTLVGKRTQLPDGFDYGSVAFDGRHHSVYVLVPPVAGVPPAEDKPAALLVFGEAQFHGQHDQSPNRTLPEPPKGLRIIVHPPQADWLLGAAFSKGDSHGRGKGKDSLYLWKAPSEGGSFVEVPALPGVKELRGMAMATD
jgi:hypothetical protein